VAKAVVVAEAQVVAEGAVGPEEGAKDVVGRAAAGPVEAGAAQEECRVPPGAGSAHALPAIPKSPISPASPALIETARTAGPA
jgi:hypothetical protein